MDHVKRLSSLLGESSPVGGSLTEDTGAPITELGPRPEKGDALTEEVWVPKPSTRATGDVAGSLSKLVTSAAAGWAKKILDGIAAGREYKSKFDPPKNLGWWWLDMEFEDWSIGGQSASGTVILEISAFRRDDGIASVGYGGDGTRSCAGDVFLVYTSDDGTNVSKRWKFDRDATPESVVEAVGDFLK